MIIGCYGDCHLTKNMRTLQDTWEVTASKSIHYMYNKFDEENVEAVVCLGDFFDAPKLEAKHLNFVLPILKEIDEKTYPTYILLGNHEADDEESNILDYLHSYDNIIPVTSPTVIESMLFLPYYSDPLEFDMRDKIVFTHHDIYGSSLASGRTKAFFGLDPLVFSEAKLVMNGHVHLKSLVEKNIVNAGSLLISQQGELRVGEYPSYYILDTREGSYSSIDNNHSMVYLTINSNEIEEISSSMYDNAHLVLRVEYEDKIPDISIDSAHISWKKIVSSIGESPEGIINVSSFDLKNYLIDYINKDQSISEESKETYISTGVRLLS